jgi:hypothetical protein
MDGAFAGKSKSHHMSTSLRPANERKSFAQGMDRNAYYQEYFLRSMPWLCKKMRRPKVGEKKSIGSRMEPNLAEISREFPVPDLPVSHEIQVVLETIKKGPRARMPIHWATDHLPPARDSRAMMPATTTTDESKPSANDAFRQPSDSFRNKYLCNVQGNVTNAPNDGTFNENQFKMNGDYAAGFKAADQQHAGQINSLRQALVRGVPGAANLNQGGTEDYLQAAPKLQLLQQQVQAMNDQIQAMQQMLMLPNHMEDLGDRFNAQNAHSGNQNEGNNGTSSRVTDYLRLLQMDESNHFNIGSDHGRRLQQGDKQGSDGNDTSNFEYLHDGEWDHSNTSMRWW